MSALTSQIDNSEHTHLSNTFRLHSTQSDCRTERHIDDVETEHTKYYLPKSNYTRVKHYAVTHSHLHNVSLFILGYRYFIMRFTFHNQQYYA